MILKNEIEDEELAEHLDWYLNNFEHVDKVYCGSDLGEGCGTLLALEMSGSLTQDAGSISVNGKGVFVLPVGPTLKSSRVRVDETSDGNKMVGYICGTVHLNPEYEPAMAQYREAAKAETDRHDNAIAEYNEKYPNPDQERPEPPQPNWPAAPDLPQHLGCNNTNLSEAEKHHPPRNGWYTDVMPHEYPAISQAIKDCGHVANYKEENGVRHYDSFRVERVK